ncbi:MAG: tetratricopeptide repeat protein [Terriglobia bacterium]
MLAAARKCIEQGTGQKGTESDLSLAHSFTAGIFNDRGLYSEALNEAQQATSLEPTNPWYFDDMARALVGLQRYTEAVSSAQAALRLSDGKYGSMHFTLGSAYFDLKNWQLAEQSFREAAQMDPKEPTSAYNVALCLQDMGDFSDAVTWYQEYLRRAPDVSDRDQVLARIAALQNQEEGLMERKP